MTEVRNTRGTADRAEGNLNVNIFFGKGGLPQTNNTTAFTYLIPILIPLTVDVGIDNTLLGE